LPELTVSYGKLRSRAGGGTQVHGASYPKRREIVLDAALIENRRELARILIHEVFHFAWPRLGNPVRRSYEQLLEAEFRRNARGELGWPSELVKLRLGDEDVEERSRRWREYACESFCDTAAWLYSGLRTHPEWTLGTQYRMRRAAWFHALTELGPLVL
jgi:hypothetical protein